MALNSSGLYFSHYFVALSSRYHFERCCLTSRFHRCLHLTTCLWFIANDSALSFNTCWETYCAFSPSGIIYSSPPTSASAVQHTDTVEAVTETRLRDSLTSHIQTAQHHPLRNAIWLETRTHTRMHSTHLTLGCVSNEAWMYNMCFTT